MGDRDYFRKDYLKSNRIFGIGDETGIIPVIILNLVIFTILLSLWLIFLVNYDTSNVATPEFYGQIINWISLPASFDTFITRPWTILTYMFVHFGFWSTLSTMLWLWAFGYIFQTLAGPDKVLPLYIYCGLAGGVMFLVSSLLLDSAGSVALRSGGTAVMGIAIAATTLSPGYRMFRSLGNGIPLWVLTAIFVLLDLLVISSNAQLAIAHAASGLMGYVFVLFLRQGKDIGAWMNQFGNWVMDLFNPGKKYSGREKERLYYKAGKQPYIKKPNLTEQKLDEILDKINQNGYDTLTEEEKEFLKKASERL